MTLDNLRIGKMYMFNKREGVYMGMISDLASPLHGFPMFVLEDGTVRVMKKTDVISAHVKPIILPETPINE